MRTEGGATTRTWTFLTNHARVLIAVARDPQARVRDLSALVGITERATQGILADLEKAGFVTRTRVGRRNEYSVHPDLEFRHPREAGHDVGELLALFVEPSASGEPDPAGVEPGVREP
ncbi:helix-turn-helix domain-containing protein [Actinotalea sp. Marseille-Q4924]|uniref:helix-turn-helix transcriptional regulator n=1 Tax=Actinotalea sp. Marseille-Q4924 TaxID=2866571 RepID=UPI001CE45E9E|nr:helix-turn-helix domain-containing protein [Actinotalea sp. Marseille-Q4924]